MILLSAHYDSYFSGFQDDNTAIALMFGIAKALLASGFKPNNTIVICAMAAEEWGVVDSNFDWSPVPTSRYSPRIRNGWERSSLT